MKTNYTPIPIADRSALFGDELIRLTAAYLANPNEDTAADYNAALINRCASMAAAAVVGLYEQVAAQHARIVELEARYGST